MATRHLSCGRRNGPITDQDAVKRDDAPEDENQALRRARRQQPRQCSAMTSRQINAGCIGTSGSFSRRSSSSSIRA